MTGFNVYGKPLENIGLGDVVKVTLTPKVPPDAGDLRQWVLFLDDVPVSGVVPDVNEKDGTLKFYLRRIANDKASTDAWAKLHRGFNFERTVSAAVGPADKPARQVAAGTVRLVIVPFGPFIACAIGMAALIIALIVLAYRSDVLRDRDTQAAPGQRRPYSLGLSQMAFWFVIVLAAYLYIGLVNWDYRNTITASTLALMGISAATGLSAVLIDQDKVTQANALRAEQATLQVRVGQLPSLIAAAAPAAQPALTDELTTKKARLDIINPQVAALPIRSWSSAGFLRDLITDEAGISFHRFQIFVWTVVLGIVFVGTVVTDLLMPEYSATLLSLMGISAGTYLGFKFPEKKG